MNQESRSEHEEHGADDSEILDESAKHCENVPSQQISVGVVIVKRSFRDYLVAAHYPEKRRESVITVGCPLITIGEFRVSSVDEREPVRKGIDVAAGIRRKACN